MITARCAALFSNVLVVSRRRAHDFSSVRISKRSILMKNSLMAILIVCFVFPQTPSSRAHPTNLEDQSALTSPASDQIEPSAGNWRTWIISSGRDYRVSPPPNPADMGRVTISFDLISQNDNQVRQQILFWNAGSPGYRWIDLINSRLLAGTPTSQYPHRVYAKHGRRGL